ncbi:MAG: transrane protein, twin-arginine translocation pathway signal [Betaproteobacteria bacterium]|nr:transrane protein, twin-arginine translocation pathway signal [Betaproteobacteria bacterium]
MNHLRRSFLAVASGASALVAAGFVKPRAAEAATWNKQGFEAKAYNDAIKGLGATNMIESKDISITAPDIAENGAVVPVAITSKIPNTRSISIVAEKNPFPLAATFDVANGAEPYASVRLKMGQTSNLRAIVKADGKYYTAAKEVKVTVGGCG